MGNGEQRVDHVSLRTVAGDIRTAHEDVDILLGNVRNAATQILSRWRGQAASAFGNLYTRWDQDTTKLTGAMDEIAALLEKSAQMHQMNDEESRQALAGIDTSVTHVDSILRPGAH